MTLFVYVSRGCFANGLTPCIQVKVLSDFVLTFSESIKGFRFILYKISVVVLKRTGFFFVFLFFSFGFFSFFFRLEPLYFSIILDMFINKTK